MQRPSKQNAGSTTGLLNLEIENCDGNVPSVKLTAENRGIDMNEDPRSYASPVPRHFSG